MFSISRNNIAIIGLGYVGLPLALAFGEKFNTIGFDINEDRIKELQNKNDTNLLSNRQSFYRSKKLKFSSNKQDLKNANIFIITVPTPVKKNKKPDLSYLYSASKIVANNLKKSDLVIYESTVYPGLTEEECVPLLEKYSNLEFNKDFFVGYSPERISPGDNKDLANISKVVSGSNPKITNNVYNLYKKIIKAKVYKATSIKVAEASKAIENAQRDINISFMNEISLICARLGINTSEVLKAANTKWNFLNFKPGLVGGHCISVDPYYLTYKSEQLGYKSRVILSGRVINDEMASYVAKKTIQTIIKEGVDVSKAKILVMGTTFKENVSDIRNSKVADLIKELKGYSVHVDVMDPHADSEELMHEYGYGLTENTSSDYNAIIVAVNHNEYSDLDSNYFTSISKPNSLLVDLKGIYRNKIDGMNYWSL
jgi:UDP-N-acetyl-D-galactosamine dehydrogenase